MKAEEYVWRDGRRLFFFCGIKGLIRDGDQLKEELAAVDPDRIYVCIAREEVEGLKKFLDEPFEVNMSDYEILYGVALSRYGEVMTPPPIFIEPVTYAKETGKEIVGLDFPEDQFSDLYSNTVRPRDLMLHSVRKRTISRKRFPQDTPEEFVLEWDRVMTRSPRLLKIEEMRIQNMFSTFMDDFRNSGLKKNFLVMEYEKCGRFKAMMADEGFTPYSGENP